MTDDVGVKQALVLRLCTVMAAASLAPLAAVPVLASAAPAKVQSQLGSRASDAPYISNEVPVPKGCIVLGRAWAGVKVYLVQRRLGTTYELDRYGNDTYHAVKHFQRSHNLKATGRVNRPTWNALGIDRKFCMDRFTVQPTVKAHASSKKHIEAMIRWARQQVGRRYVWGGAGPLGYDCSGLALQAMHAAGRVLPTVTTTLHQRQDFGTATAIFESGLRRVPLSDRRRGDLVFYGPTGAISHMAIYIGHGRVIEAVRPKVRKSGLRTHDVPLKPRVVRPFVH